MIAGRERWLIATDELAARLGDPDLVVLDGSWYLAGRDAAAEYRARHIPGALYFDIDAVADHATTLPHMLPAPEDFAAMAGALGIDETTEIVAYDADGLFSAPRVWWTFRTMGAERVRILDGGLKAWLAEGRPVEAGTAAPRAARPFHPGFDPERVADIHRVREALKTRDAQVVDGRPAARFRGEAPEPRAGLPSGHMPGSRSLPAAILADASGRIRDQAGLAATFAAAGVDPAQPIVATCGSGVVAATLVLAAEMLGGTALAVYDGSWAEWASRRDAEIVTDPLIGGNPQA